MTGKLQTLLKLSLLAVLIGGLSGCGEGLGDLRQFVQQVRAKPPGRIEPIPEFTPYQNFEYTSHDLRDPFKLVDFRRPDEVPEEIAQLGDGLRPDLDRVKEATRHIHDCLALFEERAELNPQSPRERRDVAMAHEALGRAQLMMGQEDAALRSFRKLQLIALGLSASQIEDTYVRELLAQSYEGLGDHASAIGDSAAAIENYREALDIFEGVYDEDHTRTTIARSNLAAALREIGHFDEAISMERRTTEI